MSRAITFLFALVLPVFSQAPAHPLDPDGFQAAHVNHGKVSLAPCDLSRPITVEFDSTEMVEVEIPQGSGVTEVLRADGLNWYIRFEAGHLFVKPTLDSHPTLMVLMGKDGPKVVLSLRPNYKSREQLEGEAERKKSAALVAEFNALAAKRCKSTSR